MEIYNIKNLNFKYPNRDTFAISGISLNINSGEFITVCGKSGCGKSTLLRCLKPVISPNGYKDGEILLFGEDINCIDKRTQVTNIGFVGQDPDSQIVTDKVWHELAFGLESLGVKSEEIRARVSEIASYFGIESWFHKSVDTLSGGQKQLLNLASVLVMRPKVIILDEPTSRLDPIAADRFLECLYKINNDLGITVVLSEHRLETAFAFSGRVIVMENGEIISDASPCDIVQNIKNNDMIFAMPTAMRIYESVGESDKVPVTVSDGREYVDKLSRKIKFKDVIHKVREPNSETAVSLKNIYFKYAKNEREILSDLSLKIYKGETYGILGGNGTGKTTLISVISKSLKAVSGKVEISDNKKIAILPQNPMSLFSHSTVIDELKEINDDTEDVVDLCDIGELLNFHPYDLSGGEQQKVALAKILLTNPDIMLLDEPTKGVDAFYKKKLGEILKPLNEQGITIILVTHDVEFAAEFADRCGMLFDGKIISENIPEKFFAANSFYTTSASKICKGYIDGVVLAEDAIKACGGEIRKPQSDKPKIIKTEKVIKEPEIKKEKESILPFLFVILLAPLTAMIGIKFFDDKKYYFISLLIILEAFIPFFVSFEKEKPTARKIVTVSTLCEIAVFGRLAFYMLPQVQPMLFVLIICGVCFGCKTGFLIGAISMFVSNFFFGQGPWTPWQMFAAAMVGMFAGLLFKSYDKKLPLKVAIYGFLSAIILFGGITNISMLLMSQSKITLEAVITCYAAGLPFDLINALSTACFALLFSKPMLDKINRIEIKYGF